MDTITQELRVEITTFRTYLLLFILEWTTGWFESNSGPLMQNWRSSETRDNPKPSDLRRMTQIRARTGMRLWPLDLKPWSESCPRRCLFPPIRSWSTRHHLLCEGVNTFLILIVHLRSNVRAPFFTISKTGTVAMLCLRRRTLVSPRNTRPSAPCPNPNGAMQILEQGRTSYRIWWRRNSQPRHMVAHDGGWPSARNCCRPDWSCTHSSMVHLAHALLFLLNLSPRLDRRPRRGSTVAPLVWTRLAWARSTRWGKVSRYLYPKKGSDNDGCQRDPRRRSLRERMSQIGKEEYESDMWATYVCVSERGGKRLTSGLHQSVAAFAGLDLGWAVSLVMTKSVGPSEGKLLPISIFYSFS
jgi:hypothetical protein